MSQLVQSSCPGCKKILRIPVEWLHQPMRCKYCGMVIQAKQPTTASRTPASAIKKDTTPAPTAKAPTTWEGVGGGEELGTYRSSRRRRKGGAWWKGPVLALAVFGFVLAGFGIYLKRDHLSDQLSSLLPPDDEPNGKDSRDKGATTKTTTKSAKAPLKNAPHPGGGIFPRRALVISVHDYLYANPLQNGMPGPQANNLDAFVSDLSLGLHVPLNQIALLSDDAGKKWGGPRAPTKGVIEKTLTNFLESSRPQDRVLVFFIGHAVEIGDEAYLAPIEGELDRAETLMPLKWFYEQLAKCKARQRVFVLDGNRYHRTFGQERPGGEEMGPKLDALLKAPPDGVQVWSSCVAKQRSFASDDFPMGIFLESLQKAMRQGGRGRIQKADEALPLELYVGLVNKFMKDELSKRKLEQQSRLSGKAADSEVASDPKQPPAPEAKAALAPRPPGVEQNKQMIEAVLDQIGTPPIKVTHEMPMRYDVLPPFAAKTLKEYEDDSANANSPLRQAVTKARAILWAIYPGSPPKTLSVEVNMARRNYDGVQLNILKEGYRAPGGGNAETQFKNRVEDDERRVAKLMRAVQDALNELSDPKVVEARESESKRWQANYDFMLARVQLEFAYLFEYQSMLGSIRKEFPPRDPELHGGWKLASQSKLQGDSTGKKFAKEAGKLLDSIIKKNAGTPWEVLAKREKLTNLGLEWQPAK
jgi:hypothetical protein